MKKQALFIFAGLTTLYSCNNSTPKEPKMDMKVVETYDTVYLENPETKEMTQEVVVKRDTIYVEQPTK